MDAGATDQPQDTGWYEIRLQGRLDPRWSTWLDGLDLSNHPDGTTVLHGRVVDQAALHGLLARLRDIGLPLISVTRLGSSRAQDTTHPDTPTPRLETDMTAIATDIATERVPADPTRNHARAAGLFYLLTFAASIPAWLMLDPILSDPGYIVSAGHDTQVVWACFLDFINALACVGSAVAVFPVVKRVNESLALGFVMSRMVEAAIIMTGVVALLAVVTLRQDFAGSAADDVSTLTTTGQALVATRDWTFLFGPGLMACVNAVLFGTLMFRSGLVPRFIPLMGLIGAPLLLTANMLTLFGHNTQAGGWTMLATLPIAAWELSVGFYMAFKGFRREGVNALA